MNIEQSEKVALNLSPTGLATTTIHKLQGGPKVGIQTINTILCPTLYLLLAHPVFSALSEIREYMSTLHSPPY